MNINLLGQGFEEKSVNSVGNQLIKFFADKNFHTFTGISAFASQAGIRGLSKHIKTAKKHLNIITIVTGVDQKGTSKEALEELLALDINAFVFYQPSITIFHPKIYLFEGDDKCELIIGSSNLTSQGLFTNVEASLHVSIDNSSVSDRKIVEQLKEYFNGIFDYSDPNLKKLNKKLIADLVKAKVVPTEEERKAAQDKAEKTERKETENIISKIFPKRAIAKIPSEFRGTRKPTTKTTADTAAAVSSVAGKGELVWESGKLTERDLNIPKGSNTNPTGSMLFKKGKMEDIDQRHYFRDTVFSSLKWKRDTKPGTTHLERAVATFKIVIEGKNEGTFKLTITHNTRTDTRSYEQKNSMTQISWSDAKNVIAKDNLIGKSASLFKTKKPDQFILKID
ncbi:MAG: phospholipase D family protein [Chitinophagaceae bacterium]|nr:phospholipase D family protein [Chitinophagaceae bacterium]